MMDVISAASRLLHKRFTDTKGRSFAFALPFPPSVNHYWVPGKMWVGKGLRRKQVTNMRISDEGRTFREACLICCSRERIAGLGLKSRLSVTVVLCPPSNHRRDVDNYNKGLLDGMAHAGVFADDEQIDELIVRRGPVMKEGAAYVLLKEI